MAKYRGPSCRICRREGAKLFLKGERCNLRGKCPVDKPVNPRNYPPGQHGLRRQFRISDYGVRLREKQKLRKTYGILEKQFRKYFREAGRQKGVTGDNLLRLLEMRLDNAVFRLGFVTARGTARQLVRHGHFTVNGRRVNIPSYQVKVGDVIGVSEKASQTDPVKYGLEYNSGKLLPEWLEFDAKKMEGSVVSVPARDQIPVPVDEQLVVEFYSRV
ncbi:MAG: 30S ribosomal protein S4 [Candidatus Zixiibacteriota bacterium]|jgi:small subunit ribosomal protein S4